MYLFDKTYDLGENLKKANICSDCKLLTFMAAISHEKLALFSHFRLFETFEIHNSTNFEYFLALFVNYKRKVVCNTLQYFRVFLDIITCYSAHFSQVQGTRLI